MDLKTKKHYYNRCNPDEPLRPKDERNVDIDSLGDSEIRLARGRNWVDVLATRIELSETPVCEFFTGLRGSGKSTEFLRLAERLRVRRERIFFLSSSTPRKCSTSTIPSMSPTSSS